MDWQSAFGITLDSTFLLAVLSIILIDLVLAGDNAVVIAMAVRHLPAEQRRKGILYGAGAAVALRVVATFFVAQVLTIPLVRLAGGAAVLWIAVRLFGAPGDGRNGNGTATTLAQAVRLIVIADISLSIDNMLAVGGASHGNFFLLVFGLVVSVPFVVLTSNVLSRLMATYSVIGLAGAVLLGKVGMEMILVDPLVAQHVHLLPWQHYVAEGAAAAGVVFTGRRLAGRAAPPPSENLCKAISIDFGACASGPSPVAARRASPISTNVES